MDKYWDKIKPRADQGDTPYNLRNCAYMEVFSKQKIAWAETIKEYFNSVRNFPRFSFYENCMFLDKTSFMLVGKDLKYLLGILNSSVIEYYLRQTVVKLGAGSMGLAKIYVERIPIVKPTLKTKKIVENLVVKIEKKKSKNESSNNTEKELDKIVAKLYGLTKEEIIFTESQ